MDLPLVLVMGTGSIGGYLGGCLQASGVPVVFVARPRMLEALRAHGLTLTDLDGGSHRLAPDRLQLHETIPAASVPSIVLLAVKSGATAEAAAQLAAALPAGTPVLSLQNGVANVARAQAAAPGLRVLAGMVPFNVAELGPGRLHRGTVGAVAAQDDPATRALQPLFERAGFALELHADLRPLQWGKLLINLNNPVNALSGLPLRAQLLDRGYRQCFAALQAEALQVLQAAGIVPAQVTPLPPQRLPMLLRLPTFVFRAVAARMLRIDAKARSSMADDLALGRTTEIDALCGEVLRLAQAHGMTAPLNARITALVEAWPQRRRPMSSQELKSALGL